MLTSLPSSFLFSLLCAPVVPYRTTRSWTLSRCAAVPLGSNHSGVAEDCCLHSRTHQSLFAVITFIQTCLIAHQGEGLTEFLKAAVAFSPNPPPASYAGTFFIPNNKVGILILSPVRDDTDLRYDTAAALLWAVARWQWPHTPLVRSILLPCMN